MDNYEKQAEDFLKKTGTTFKAEFLRWDFYFPDDKDKRDIYQIALTRGSRVYSFKFGNSVFCSGEYEIIFPSGERKRIHLKKNRDGKPNKYVKEVGGFLNSGNSKKNKDFKIPTPYDVLACLQKSEVGTFEDFCSNFGYDTDSIKAERIYKAVSEEYKNVCALFNEKELEELQEIS